MLTACRGRKGTTGDDRSFTGDKRLLAEEYNGITKALRGGTGWDLREIKTF